MKQIRVQNLGLIEIPDEWDESQIKCHILSLRKDLPEITIDWSINEASPIVTGDANAFKPLFDAYCTWGKDSLWHTEPRHAERIRQASYGMKFNLTEIMPKSSPVKSSKDAPGVAGAQTKASRPPSAQGKAPAKSSRSEAKEGGANVQTAGAAPKPTPSAGHPELVSGTIQHFTEKMTKGSAKRPSTPYLNVLLKTESGDRWYSMFDRDLFDFVSKAKGKSGEFFFSQSGDFYNIVGIKTLAGREFEDGKIPVVQNRDREAGTSTLFK